MPDKGQQDPRIAMSPSEAFAKAGKTAIQQNVQGTLTFLQRHPPFDQMEPAHLAYLVEQCHLRFFAEGESILRPDDGPVQHFHILKQGRVIGVRTGLDGQRETTFEISRGECFPLAALLAERATRTEHLAAEDTFCLQLPKQAFIRLFTLSDVFRDFALRGISSLLDQVNRQVQRQAVATLGTQYSLNTRLGDLALRHPVTCPPETPVREAVRAMHEQQVGSIIVIDATKAPLGIFTLRDLRHVIAEGADLDQPVAQHMTAQPYGLSPEASAFDAALGMTQRGVTHVCLVKDGRLCGVISERDLFSLQRVDLVHLARALRQAPRLDTLANMRGEIPQLVERMLAHGASSTQITRIITLLNDQTVCRAIELAVQQLGDPGIPFTWLCFGSEARHEQTLHTDQDNGILFQARDDAEAEAIRKRLLPLAQVITQYLDQCGMSLCKGQIMASNPALCLSQAEWSRRFAGFIREANPENLLGSSIYFDLRAVWGPEDGPAQLRREVLAQVADNRIFQRMLADNALRQRPPLGRLRGFVLSRQEKGQVATLDLKVQGLTPFVDGARLLALANGVQATNTLDRLRELVAREVIDPLDGAAFEEAYHFIQQMRLQLHQRQARNNLPWSNRIDPDSLNELDRRILRESLRQAQRLQGSLSLRYQL